MRGVTRIAVLAAGLAMGVAGGAAGQAGAWAPSRAARAQDVGTIDGIVRAFYEAVSGPAGQPRDWARDSTLYLPGLVFTSVGTVDFTGRAMGPMNAESVTHAEYVTFADSAMVEMGFYERETARTVQRFGHIATVWSSYEGRSTADGPVLSRGVTSLQLVWDGERWWIAHVMWDEGDPASPPTAVGPER